MAQRVCHALPPGPGRDVQELPGAADDSVAVRWTTVSMADLERPPTKRPVFAGASLRSVRTVDNLQRLLDGRPAGHPPAGLLRTQTLSPSTSEVRADEDVRSTSCCAAARRHCRGAD